MPAETTAEASELLLSYHLLGLDKPDQLERYFFDQPLLRSHFLAFMW